MFIDDTENNKSTPNADEVQDITPPSLEDIEVDEELELKIQEQEQKQPLLIVRNLNKYFKKGGTFFKAVNNANFDVYEKDFFGIIGESGSGKSTIGKLLIRLLHSDSGTTIFDNNIISDRKITKKLNKWLTNNMQMIFQDPMSSLNPKKNVLNLIAEPLMIKKTLSAEANQIIKDHIKINSYFQCTYKQKDFEISKKFDDYYFPEMIKLYANSIQKIDNFEYDLSLKFDENKFNFLAILLDLDEKSKKVNYSLYKHAEDINNIFYECKEIHDKKQNDPREIKLFEITNQIKEQKYALKYSPEYLEIKNNLIQTKIELENHLLNSTEKYREQIKNYIVGAKESYKKEIKTLTNKLILTQNFISAYETKINIEIKKTCIEALDFIDELKYLSLFDARDAILKTEAWVEEIYKPIFVELDNLKKLKYQKDKLAKQFILSDQLTASEMQIVQNNEATTSNNLIESVLTEIKNKNFELKNSVDAIDAQFLKLETMLNELNINEILHSTDFHNLFKIDDYISYQQSLVDIQKTEVYQKQIEYYQKQIAIAKKNIKVWRNTETYLQQKNEHEKTKELAKQIKASCMEHYKKSYEEFERDIQPQINEHNKFLFHWKSELSHLKSQLKKVTNAKVNQIIKMLKQQIKENLNHDVDNEILKSFKNDISIKLKTIDALTFEFNTILEEVTTYRDLRSKNKLLVWLNKKELVGILTKKKVYEALNSVGLKNEHAYRYPHEFSGGQRQRIVIARALINNPKIIIADEPISALDVSIQAQVINIMKDLAEKKGITFLFIAHDLSMVNYACNRMIIMHNGRILEKGDTNEIFKNPIHPYTLSLLKSAPQLSKIHIDLASSDANDAGYGTFNLPNSYYSFHSVNKKKEHFVFGTEEQIKLWSKKTH